MKPTVDRVLDFLGTVAAGAVVVASTGVAMPGWLVALAAIVAYGSGKAATPGVPFRKAKDTTPTDAP